MTVLALAASVVGCMLWIREPARWESMPQEQVRGAAEAGDTGAQFTLAARYELDLRGPGGGPLRVSVDGGRVEVAPEPDPAADVRLRLDARDYFAVLEGRENADLLYMAGSLEIEGDLSLAIKLRTLFRPLA